MDAKALEQILRPTNPTLEQERAAEAGGRWKEYLRERVPPPSRLLFGRRGAWQSAYDRALAIGNAREVRSGLVVALWYCENQDDEASHAWTKVAVVSFDDDSYALVEKATLGDCVALVRLEQARRGFIMPSRFYAPSVDLPYRNEHYVALESRSIERVVAVERLFECARVSMPTRDVPPLWTDAEAAVALDSVDPDLAQRIRQLVERLRIFPSET